MTLFSWLRSLFRKPQKPQRTIAMVEIEYHLAVHQHKRRSHLLDEMCRLRIEGLKREGYGR
jgi:hypothetical protein